MKRLKQLAADLSLDKEMLQEVVCEKSSDAGAAAGAGRRDQASLAYELPRDRHDPCALRVSTVLRAAAARGLAGERQADLSVLQVSSDTYFCELRRHPDSRSRASSTYNECQAASTGFRVICAEGSVGCPPSYGDGGRRGSHLEGVLEFPQVVAPVLGVEHMRSV